MFTSNMIRVRFSCVGANFASLPVIEDTFVFMSVE